MLGSLIITAPQQLGLNPEIPKAALTIKGDQTHTDSFLNVMASCLLCMKLNYKLHRDKTAFVNMQGTIHRMHICIVNQRDAVKDKTEKTAIYQLLIYF